MPHVHRATGRDDFLRPDGVREVWWKCGCGLEEKRLFRGSTCVGVRYRFGGAWMEAADLLSLTVPLSLCADCSGNGCPGCDGTGVSEKDGDRIVAPAPAGVS